MFSLKRIIAKNTYKHYLCFINRDLQNKKYSAGRSDNILKSKFPDIDVPSITISDFILESSGAFMGNNIAAECGISGRKYTYDELRSKSKNLGGALRTKFKLKKGEVVAIILPNCPEFAVCSIGIIGSGLIATTCNPIYTPEEIARQLKDSGAKVVITLSELYPHAEKSTKLSQNQIPIIEIMTNPAQNRQGINFNELVNTKTDLPNDTKNLNPDDVAILPYSSGTTGMPKGVMLTHRNIVANLCQINIPELRVCEDATANHQDVVPVILPQFHIYGMTVNTFHTLHKGCKLICLPKFSPDLLVKTLANHKPNIMFVAPPMVIFMTAHDSVKSKYLQSLHSVISGAAPLGILDEENFVKKAEKKIIMRQGFGMTETSPAIALSSNNPDKIQGGSIGGPIPNTEIKIASLENPDGEPLGPNQKGELWVRGPQNMLGYHNRPEETQKTLTPDGWLKTGDVGYYNEDGICYITDRLKELIKVKGFQVPPAELEEVIRSMGDIADVGVIGVPHERFGEVPRAYVVVKDGATVSERSIQDFVADKVASYKQLVGGVCIIDAVPKNPTGKIMRKELRNMFERGK